MGRKHCGKRRTCSLRAIYPFPTGFQKVFFPGASKVSLCGNGLINPFPNKPLFIRVCSRSLLKTLWEKKTFLVTSNFSLSNSVFYPFFFFKLSTIFITNFKLLSAKSFKLEELKVFRFGKGKLVKIFNSLPQNPEF